MTHKMEMMILLRATAGRAKKYLNNPTLAHTVAKKSNIKITTFSFLMCAIRTEKRP